MESAVAINDYKVTLQKYTDYGRDGIRRALHHAIISPVLRIFFWIICTELFTQKYPRQKLRLTDIHLPSPDSGKPGFLSEEQWQPLDCAGMVLLWPLLPGLFRHLGLVERGLFVGPKAQRRAAGCLLWLATRQDMPPAEQKVCQLLCELPSEVHIGEKDMPDGFTREKLRHWMNIFLPLLPPVWQELSGEDVRQRFLLRPGWIHPEQEKSWLSIQPAASDSL